MASNGRRVIYHLRRCGGKDEVNWLNKMLKDYKESTHVPRFNKHSVFHDKDGDLNVEVLYHGTNLSTKDLGRKIKEVFKDMKTNGPVDVVDAPDETKSTDGGAGASGSSK